MNEVMKSFWELVDNIGDVLEQNLDYKTAEPNLVKLLTLVQRNPDLNSEFEEAFLKMVKQPDSYSSLAVEFCMHTLKFAKVKEFAESRLNSHPLRIDIRARHVVDSFDDNWKTARLFPFYKVKSNQPK